MNVYLPFVKPCTNPDRRRLTAAFPRRTTKLKQLNPNFLELLIVCLLISISLALAIPNLRRSMVTDELASGSRKIISLIKSSRARAVTSHKAFLICYDAAEGRLWDCRSGRARGPYVGLYGVPGTGSEASEASAILGTGFA